MHAVTVQLDFVQPIGSIRCRFHKGSKLGLDPGGNASGGRSCSYGHGLLATGAGSLATPFIGRMSRPPKPGTKQPGISEMLPVAAIHDGGEILLYLSRATTALTKA
jgi:hypothetical protein